MKNFSGALNVNANPRVNKAPFNFLLDFSNWRSIGIRSLVAVSEPFCSAVPRDPVEVSTSTG